MNGIRRLKKVYGRYYNFHDNLFHLHILHRHRTLGPQPAALYPIIAILYSPSPSSLNITKNKKDNLESLVEG
jgi:hypothetical protein